MDEPENNQVKTRPEDQPNQFASQGEEANISKNDSNYPEDEVDKLIRKLGILSLAKFRKASVSEIVLTLTSIALTIIGFSQLVVAWENYRDTSPLVGYAKTTSTAAKDFATAAGGINQGVQNAVGQLNRQAGATENTANAAKNAADTSKAALHISERAYVVIDGPAFNFPSKSITLPLVNTGHIPSGELNAVVHWATINLPNASSTVDTSMFVHKDWQHYHWDSIAPGGHPGNEFPFPLMDTDRINNGTQLVVIAGTLSYNDGFAESPQQVWKFCFESIYHLLMKKTVLGPCNPTDIIPVLEKADGYPHNEHKD